MFNDSCQSSFTLTDKPKLTKNHVCQPAFWLFSGMVVEWLRTYNCGFEKLSCMCIHVLGFLGAEVNQV
jgi:hypothetical protein